MAALSASASDAVTPQPAIVEMSTIVMECPLAATTRRVATTTAASANTSVRPRWRTASVSATDGAVTDAVTPMAVSATGSSEGDVAITAMRAAETPTTASAVGTPPRSVCRNTSTPAATQRSTDAANWVPVVVPGTRTHRRPPTAPVMP